MATLIRNIPIASVNLRSLLPFLLVILFIIGLFFLPEIIKFGSKSSRSNSSEDAALIENQQAPVTVSPLEAVLSSLESRGRSGVRSDGSILQDQSGIVPATGKKVTWDNIRSDAQPSILRARKEAVALVADLAKEHVESRRALHSMISAIDFINSDANSVMDAEEALSYLEAADVSVAAALQSDKVDRTIYIKWMEVSLAPSIGAYSAQRIKEQFLNPFDPQLRLKQIELTKVKGPPGAALDYGTRLLIRGVVRGKDIKYLKLFRNSQYVREVPFGQPDNLGDRNFTISQPGMIGNWIFRAIDTKGEVYEKAYRFYPIIERFPQENFAYKLPYDPTVVDPRLDRLFRVAERKGPNKKELVDFDRF